MIIACDNHKRISQKFGKLAQANTVGYPFFGAASDNSAVRMLMGYPFLAFSELGGAASPLTEEKRSGARLAARRTALADTAQIRPGCIDVA